MYSLPRVPDFGREGVRGWVVVMAAPSQGAAFLGPPLPCPLTIKPFVLSQSEGPGGRGNPPNTALCVSNNHCSSTAHAGKSGNRACHPTSRSFALAQDEGGW